MAEVLKRWDGTQWVTVTTVNRLEVGGNSGPVHEDFFKLATGILLTDGVPIESLIEVNEIVGEVVVI